MEAIVVTPVKDSLETTRRTLEAVAKESGNFRYVVFDDFSEAPTRNYLEENQEALHFTLIHLDEYTANPSPNYKLVLEMGQAMALEAEVPLIIVESDVIIRENSLSRLAAIAATLPDPGLAGLITVNENGDYNFPYAAEKRDGSPWVETQRSLSFCCTLISPELLRQYNFRNLSPKKDWYDIHISRQSRKLGFRNYLIKEAEVIHLPHSSRPWKQLKYTHPFRYYFYKLTRHRDRI